ncbi:unnamed protein product [Heterobilharzia americana]|nr:unnamed protein product [Heterobilharzia americana]
MKLFKRFLSNHRTRFRAVIFLVVSTVVLTIWYMRGNKLDEIVQYISNYNNLLVSNLNHQSAIYSDFRDFKKDVINGRLRIKRWKVHEITIYGQMLADINKDVSSCSMNNCFIHTDMSRWKESDIILIPNNVYPYGERPEHQVWVAYDYEAPVHTRLRYELNDKINFTATYRFDSTIRTPYGMYTENTPLPPPPPTTKSNETRLVKLKSVAAGKEKYVAWIVSNCNSHSPRYLYASELAKYIAVDVYGNCGQMLCRGSNCFDMLRKHYKFYLSFENALCQDYITEKFFFNALIIRRDLLCHKLTNG